MHRKGASSMAVFSPDYKCDLVGTAWVTSPLHKSAEKTVLFYCRASISGSEDFS